MKKVNGIPKPLAEPGIQVFLSSKYALYTPAGGWFNAMVASRRAKDGSFVYVCTAFIPSGKTLTKQAQR